MGADLPEARHAFYPRLGYAGVHSESWCPTFALSGRGERTRASGPLERIVGHPVRDCGTTARHV